jgi:hypothetical protein
MMSADAQRSAGSAAAGAQGAASEAGIAEQRRQFDAVQKLLSPYVSTGEQAITGQGALVGLGGQAAQEGAVRALEGSPQFAALQRQGENALLQNASATGGLRGGNVQGALAQFRPQLLNQLIESQFTKLGSLSSLGQASAVGQANASQNTGTNISNLLGQQGQAQAGAALASGQATANQWSGLAGTVGQLGMMKAMKVF